MNDSPFWLGFLFGIIITLIILGAWFLVLSFGHYKENKNGLLLSTSDRKGPFHSLQYPLYENMESALWLNRIVGKLWEKLETTWSDLLKDELQQLAKKHQPSFLKDVAVTHLTLGRQAPELHNLKCFRTYSTNTILLDADVDWLARSSEIRVAATLFGIKPPLLSVRKINVHAKLRLQILLSDCLWGIESFHFSFVQQPKVHLEIIPLASGLDLMDIPAFRSWLYHLLTVRAFEKMLFPKKISIPIQPPLNRSSSPPTLSSSLSPWKDSNNNVSYPPGTDGILTIRILSAQISTTNTKYSEWNPSITIHSGSQVMSSQKSYRTNQPIFEEKFEFLISKQSMQWINIRLYHHPQGLFQILDSLGQDVLIGSGWLPLQVCKNAIDKNMDIWLPLTASKWNIPPETVHSSSIASVHLIYSYEKIWNPNELNRATPNSNSYIQHNISKNMETLDASIKGWIQIHLLEAYQLHHLDNPDHFISDVRCVLEWGSHKISFTSIENEVCPIWNAYAEFPVCDIQEEYLTLTVMDQDPFAKEALLGRAFICVDHYGDIEPKEYWVPIHKKDNTLHSSSSSIVTSGWIRLWLTFQAILQDEEYQTWTRSGNYFVIQPNMDYWKNRMVSAPLRNNRSQNSIQLFRQLESLDWRETVNLVMRTTPLSLWRMANQSLYNALHPTQVSSLFLSSSINNNNINEEEEEENEGTTLNTWMVTIQTGDCWGAGTDASVWIQFFDENGNHTRRFLLSNSDGSHFCRGGQDTFMIPVSMTSSPCKIRIGHEGRGLFPSWYLKSIIIQSTREEDAWKREFVCNQWVVYSRDNDGIELYPVE